jgi:hypothetical protein
MINQLKRLQIAEIEMSMGGFMLFGGNGPGEVRGGEEQGPDRPASGAPHTTATIKDDTGFENAIRFAGMLGARNVTGDDRDILKRSMSDSPAPG